MSWEEAIYVKSKIQEILAKDNSYSLPPKEMAACSATAGIEKVDLSWQLPSDTVVDNQLLVDVAGVIIVRKKDSAPQSLLDGVVVLNSTDSIGSYTDTDVEAGETYYYRFFPYSTENTVSMSPNNIKSAEPAPIPIYAFHDDFTDLNPNTRITYPEGVVNESYIPMHTNEDTGTPTAGSWDPFLSDVLKNKPAMVKTDGELDYWLDPNDYTKKLDGTASDVSNTSYSGAGAFAWINKLYMKEVYDQDDNGRTVYFSPVKVDNDYYPVGFVDGDNNELDGIWIPMFYMSKVSEYNDNVPSKVVNTNSKPFGNLSSSLYARKIAASSPRARFYGGPIYNVLRDLEYMLFKSTDLFDKAGYGANLLSTDMPITPNNFFQTGLIIPNGTVSGFYGSGTRDNKNSQLKANKVFHSPVLGSLYLKGPNPYIGASATSPVKIRYNSKYEFAVAIGDSVYSDSDTYISGGNGYCTRMRLVSKDYGSIPYYKTKEGASLTTGLLSEVTIFQNREYTNNGIVTSSYRPAIDCRSDYGGIDRYSFYNSQAAGNSSYDPSYPIYLILPPASYDPNT